MGTIRWRIGISVFSLVAVLQAGLCVYVLERLEQAHHLQVDDDLLEEILELAELSDRDAIARYVRDETAHNTHWDEDFFEVRDAAGQLLASSPNVPEQGLGSAIRPRELQPRRRRG
jgi:hypothetical protein